MARRPAAPGPDDSLDALLARWRASRAAADAEDLERQTARGLGEYDAPALDGRFHAAWLRRAAERDDALTTGWLASTLSDRLAAPRSGRVSVGPALERLLARLAALSRRLPDPRVAVAVIQLIDGDRLVPTVRQGPEHGALLDVLEACGDPRQAGALEALASRARQRLEGQRAVRAEVRARRVAEHWLVAGAPRVVRSLAGLGSAAQGSRAPGGPASPVVPAAPLGQTLDGLLARVVEHWDDDAPLAVLADYLSAQGAPLGEHLQRLLALPRAERALGAPPPRSAQAAWLGPDLTPVLTGLRFERGLLVGASLANPAKAAEVVWRRAMGASALATVQELERGRASVERYARFLAAPALLGLRRVAVEQLAELDALLSATRARSIRELRFTRHAPDAELLARVASAPAFASLERLDSRGGAELVDHALASPLGARLVSLGVIPSTSDDGSGALRRFATAPSTLTRLAVGDLALVRGGGGFHLEICAPRGRSLSPELLSLLPDVPGNPLHVRAVLNRYDKQAFAPLQRWAKARKVPFDVAFHDAQEP